MGLGATLTGAATAGLAGAVTGGIGSIISGGLGLLGGLFKRNNNGLKNQQKLMQQAWEYEKEGMGLQYNYGQQAADAEYRRNLQMWKDTNFGAQRDEMEKAGLSVGLMFIKQGQINSLNGLEIVITFFILRGMIPINKIIVQRNRNWSNAIHAKLNIEPLRKRRFP